MTTGTRSGTGTPPATSPPSSPPPCSADLVKAEGIRRGADHVRQFTILGDGAAWIWNIASSKFPEATQIVDLFHAREHLHDLARLLEFMLRRPQGRMARRPPGGPGLRRHRRHLQGRPRSTRLEGIKKDELDTALGYFENNAPRMRYHWFRSRGLFVGSGVVEAGCKAVIGQRLKLSGMRLDRRRRRAPSSPALPAGQQPRRPDLESTAQPDATPPDEANLLNDLDHLQNRRAPPRAGCATHM